jgi:putative acetyltransferase
VTKQNLSFPELQVRCETPADHDAIREVNRQAFGRPNEARLVDAIRQTAAFIHDLSLVAVRDGRVVGHALFSRVTVEGEGQPAELLALAPVAVLPECQRRGVGRQLIGVGLACAAMLGHAAVVVVGHPAYYPRFGFTSARAFGLEAPFPVADEAFLALPLRPGALDGVRGLVIYPAAFNEV